MPTIFDGTNGLTFNDGTQMGSANSLGMRNVVFNGDFRVNQRIYVSGAVLAAGVYGHDRFKAGASGGDYSFTQLNSSTQITIASGKSLIQVVEDKNVSGGSYILSWVGTALGRVGVNTATPAGIFVVSPILITGQTAGTTMSFELNAGTVNTVQLEQGSVATPFERRPIGLELALCQRYFQKTYDQTVAPGAITALGALYRSADAVSNYFSFEWQFPVSMRTAPACILFNPSTGGTGSFSSDASAVPAGVTNTSTRNAVFRANNSQINTNSFVSAQATASAEL